MLDEILKKLVGLWRIDDGRREWTSFCIIDSQRVQNADTAREKGYDAGKKVSVIKRHIAVDTNGLPHAIHVTTANISDKAGAREMIECNKTSLCHVVNILCDGGYTGKPFPMLLKKPLARMWRLSSAMKCINLLSFRSGGWSRVPLDGLTNAVDFGKTVNASSIPVYKCLCLPLSLYCLKDSK